jgi:hypothetical protein
MSLSTKQLAELRHDITSLADIKYDHLTDELLDHYATLTEENMATGLSFYEASTAAFLAMGNGEGIRRIQVKYEIETKRQVKKRHLAILKSFLRWPTVVTTLLVGTLFISLYVNLPTNYARGLSVFVLASPIIFVLGAYVFYCQRKNSRDKIAWEYLTEWIQLPNLTLQCLNLTNSMSDDKSFMNSLTGQGIQFCFALITLALTISLVQLTRETFYYKLNFQR